MATANEPFSYTNGTTLSSLDPPWKVVYGNFLISSSRAAGSAAALNLAYWDLDTYSADQYAEAVLIASSFQYPGLSVRVSGTGTGDAQAYNLVMAIAEGQMSIQKLTGTGTPTLYTSASAPVSGHTYKITVATVGGNAVLTIFDNGSNIGTYTDTSSPFLTGQPGIFTYDSAAFDDFVAGDLAPSTQSYSVTVSGGLTASGSATVVFTGPVRVIKRPLNTRQAVKRAAYY